MRVAIGSYCYHCYFGEAYAALQPPADRAINRLGFRTCSRAEGDKSTGEWNDSHASSPLWNG